MMLGMSVLFVDGFVEMNRVASVTTMESVGPLWCNQQWGVFGLHLRNDEEKQARLRTTTTHERGITMGSYDNTLKLKPGLYLYTYVDFRTGDWWYWDDKERDEDNHQYNCTCESCLQNHPERDILYGDGNYFEYGDEE